MEKVVVLRREGPLDPRHAASIIDDVSSALDAAHKRGLVHRDVKPANILIEAGDGHVFLTDFGLARQVDANTGVTATGAFVGTLDYVAPEQIRGERVDARADVYALGCVLFELLTGTTPFAARDDKVAKMYAHLEEEPPSLRVLHPELPAGLDPVLKRALAKDPADRFPSAGDLARAVDAAVEGGQTMEAERSVGVGAAAPGPPEATTTAERMRDKSTVAAPPPASAPARRRSRTGILALGAAAIAAVVVVIIVAVGGAGDDGGRPSSNSNTDAATTTTTTTSSAEPRATIAQGPVPVGKLPVNLAHGQEGLWVTNRVGASLSLVDGDPGKELAEIQLGLKPEGVAVGDGSIWVGAYSQPTLIRVDPDNPGSQTRITVGAPPGNVAFANGSIWVANSGANTLSKVDTSTETVKTIQVGQNPYGLTAGDGGIWVTNRGDGTIQRINTLNGHPDDPIGAFSAGRHA